MEEKFNLKDFDFITDSRLDIKSELNEQRSFKLNQINNVNWISLNFNLIFMSMIKFHEQIGLSLDPVDVRSLKNVYCEMEKKIFPKQRISEKKIVTGRNEEDTYEYNEEVKNPNVIYDIKKNNFEKFSSENLENENFFDCKNINTGKKEFNLLKIDKEKVNKISEENFVNENIFAGHLVNRGNRNRKKEEDLKNNFFVGENNIEKKEYNKNKNAHLSSKERNTAINSTDSADVMPELYKFCTDFLKKKFNLDRIDYNILKSIGICRIFKEHLKENRIDSRMDMDYLALVANLRQIVSEKMYTFLEYFAFRNKNNDNLINVQQFFAKIEEVLLKYSIIENIIK